jgi:hypothetical protein
MTKFEQALLEELIRIRAEFASHDLNHMDFNVSCYGPVHGDLKIEFRIESDYTGGAIRGNTVDATMQEFFRQREWRKRHAALALPYTTQSALANLDEDNAS